MNKTMGDIAPQSVPQGGTAMISPQEYEYFARRRAFEALLAGERIWEMAKVLDLEPGTRSYALALFAVPAGADRLRDALLGHFLKYPEYILLPWSVREYLVIIKADAADLDRCSSRCVGAIRESFESCGGGAWHVAVTPPVDSVEALPECYETLSRLWAHRYLLPGEHLLTRDTVGQSADEEERLLDLDVTRVDPKRLRDILETASVGEVPGLVAQLLEEMGDAMNSDALCRFLAIGTRFAGTRFVAERGFDQREFIRSGRLALPARQRITPAVLEDYMVRTLRAAIRFRDGEPMHRCRGVLQQAAAYVSGHFSREELSLNQVAAAVDLSPNYLSALFRREMGCTFVEFVTEKRMALARELLEATDLRSGEVARAVGYRDPRYFSSLFKKTQGMTPREYRAKSKSADGR